MSEQLSDQATAPQSTAPQPTTSTPPAPQSNSNSATSTSDQPQASQAQQTPQASQASNTKQTLIPAPVPDVNPWHKSKSSQSLASSLSSLSLADKSKTNSATLISKPPVQKRKPKSDSATPVLQDATHWPAPSSISSANAESSNAAPQGKPKLTVGKEKWLPLQTSVSFEYGKPGKPSGAAAGGAGKKTRKPGDGKKSKPQKPHSDAKKRKNHIPSHISATQNAEEGKPKPRGAESGDISDSTTVAQEISPSEPAADSTEATAEPLKHNSVSPATIDPETETVPEREAGTATETEQNEPQTNNSASATGNSQNATHGNGRFHKPNGYPKQHNKNHRQRQQTAPPYQMGQPYGYSGYYAVPPGASGKPPGNQFSHRNSTPNFPSQRLPNGYYAPGMVPQYVPYYPQQYGVPAGPRPGKSTGSGSGSPPSGSANSGGSGGSNSGSNSGSGGAASGSGGSANARHYSVPTGGYQYMPVDYMYPPYYAVSPLVGASPTFGTGPNAAVLAAAQGIPGVVADARLAVAQQLSYYFSVENLCKDMYFRQLMNSQGFVPLKNIANFNRMKSLTGGNDQLLIDSLEFCPNLELRGSKVRLVENWQQWVFPVKDRAAEGQDETTGEEADKEDKGKEEKKEEKDGEEKSDAEGVAGKAE